MWPVDSVPGIWLKMLLRGPLITGQNLSIRSPAVRSCKKLCFVTVSRGKMSEAQCPRWPFLHSFSWFQTASPLWMWLVTSCYVAAVSVRSRGMKWPVWTLLIRCSLASVLAETRTRAWFSGGVDLLRGAWNVKGSQQLCGISHGPPSFRLGPSPTPRCESFGIRMADSSA